MKKDIIKKLIDDFYEEFKGMPGDRPIVRNRQKDDAFELVVLKVMYEKKLNLTFKKEFAEDLAQYVIAPPDSGIDIFVEREDQDELTFDVIQVKNRQLTEDELRDALSKMRRTINTYCKSAKQINSENCREILSNSNLDSKNKKNCRFFIVHTGDLDFITDQRKDEFIINAHELHILATNVQDKVEHDTLPISGAMEVGSKSDSLNAVVCSINCNDLAELNNRYYSPGTGRNSLFGHNLRESLGEKTSKSYQGMKKTIQDCPENFWYYNNGITIIAENVDLQRNAQEVVTGVDLNNFSIVNGAQTTSSLGMIKKQAHRDGEHNIEINLRKASVIARILKVDDPVVESDIAIFNNTQNPITSRDMVSRNIEQRKLYDRLIDDSDYPAIYMEIRRGAKPPRDYSRGYAHRTTTNEALAQLALAGFLLDPATAKNKKKSLFNYDYTHTEYTMNETYHKVFHYEGEDDSKNGVLFRKSKNEIDELLFVEALYDSGKKYIKKDNEAYIEQQQKLLDNALDDQKLVIQERIDDATSVKSTAAICKIFFVSTYYEYLEQFGGPWNERRYDFDRYYDGKEYRQKMIEDMANFFLMKTIKILIRTSEDNGYANNINNWIRSANCADAYMKALRSDIRFERTDKTKYEELMKTYKTVEIM